MFLAPTVSSLMAYFVAILTPNSARSCVMQSTLPTKGMRSIISTVSISLEDFMSSILLWMVIIGAVVIVYGISRDFIFVTGMLSRFNSNGSSKLCGSPPMKASISFSEFGTMFGHKNANS
ncbi:hypothetical protein Tco_1525102 [Tanacetum coccineum]